jgi:hypothetical protein
MNEEAFDGKAFDGDPLAKYETATPRKAVKFCACCRNYVAVHSTEHSNFYGLDTCVLEATSTRRFDGTQLPSAAKSEAGSGGRIDTASANRVDRSLVVLSQRRERAQIQAPKSHKVIRNHRRECCLISSLAFDVTHKKRWPPHCKSIFSSSSV